MRQNVLSRLGIEPPRMGVAVGLRRSEGGGRTLVVRSPIDGAELAEIHAASLDDLAAAIGAAERAFEPWRVVPAPKRGEVVRRFGQMLREHKQPLAELVTLEVGKIPAEAMGEVQEMIDVCDFAVGLSRQLYGMNAASERPMHRLSEYWHPLGPAGVITAFNFPVAVWAWNAAIALVCGDTLVWKPSEKTPLCAMACQSLLARTIEASRDLSIPPDISSVVIGSGAEIGFAMAESHRLPLISATGSVRMGRSVGAAVAGRLGRSILELGGNNAMVVAPSADLDMATRAIVFAAAGTAGQRCTSLRRLIVHRDLKAELVRRLREVYARLRVGDPRKRGVLVGPLIDDRAGRDMAEALETAREQGGEVFGGERLTRGVPRGGVYCRPAIVEIGPEAMITKVETFAPILYVMEYAEIEQAVAMNNGVPQGLTSAIFTRDVREAEMFCGPAGSDCGIANVNIGTSGAEIGGAFGGEKDTGGGRESGSDSWKAYMRRMTTTVNYGRELPLAQGVKFTV